MKAKAIALLLIMLGIASAASPQVRALTACSDIADGVATYQSIVPLQKGIYSAYVRLNKNGQSAQAAVAEQSITDEKCTPIAEVSASDAAWTKLGSITAEDISSTKIVNVAIADAQAGQDASSPSLLLVPSAGAPCADVNVCTVTYKGQKYTLQPQKISLNSDTLRVALYLPVTDSLKIKKAIFYSDNKPLYSSTTNTVFNTRYVGSGDHTLKTSIILENGQVLEKIQKVDYPFDLAHFALPAILRNAGIFVAAGVVAALYVLYLLAVSLMRKIVERRRWKRSHFAQASVKKTGEQSSVELYAQFQKQESTKKDVRLTFVWSSVPLVLLGTIVLSTTLVMGRFTVDGVSMETTLSDKSGQWLYKLPVTLAGINKTSPSLQRGDVVVLHHDDNNLFDQSAETERTYVVKRVLGFPGERVRVSDGQLLVYPVGSKDPIDPDKDQTWQSVTTPSIGRYIDITLKAGELFVVGDNRVDSIDSRYYGPVSQDDIVGKVLYKVSSHNKPYASP